MTTLAWHFCADDNGKPCLSVYESEGLRSNGPEVEVGVTLTVPTPIVPCEHGLHGSTSAFDALTYCPEYDRVWICRTLHGGEIKEHGSPVDKIASSERTALWCADATDTLRAYARWCALQVIDLWNAPLVVRQFLETGDESLRVAARVAARDAAWAAAEAAEWSAAKAADNTVTEARIVVYTAATCAATAATYAATYASYASYASYAARNAAWATAGDAARDRQRAKLEEMLVALEPKATHAEEGK